MLKNSLLSRTILRVAPFMVLALFTLTACFGNNSNPANSSAHQRITTDAGYQMMRELTGYVLLDVRTPAEFRERHITGAINIPVNEISRRATNELPDKNAVLFVYCRTGARSETAARTLAQMGYTQVFNIGGIVDWRGPVSN